MSIITFKTVKNNEISHGNMVNTNYNTYRSINLQL